MTHIDSSISETVLDANQRAVIEKYGFEMRDKGGQFELTDPIVRKTNRGKGGKHMNGDADTVLSAAVAERQAHDKAVAAAPPVAPKGKGKAATKADAPAQTEVQPEPEQQPEPETTVYLDSDGKPQREPDPQPEGTLLEVDLPGRSEDVDTNESGNLSPQDEQLAEGVVNQPGNEIEVDETDLDNSGKRAKKSKKEEKGPRKDNRYLRAAKIIVTDLEIDAEQLAGKADMSEATAGHCLEAWRGVVAELLEQGWIAPGKAKALKASLPSKK